MDEFNNYYCKKNSGQIPAFGNWDYANDLPITQYFECARQAGLLRYSCSGECDLYGATDFKKQPPQTATRPKSRGVKCEKRGVPPPPTDQTRRQRHRRKSSDVEMQPQTTKYNKERTDGVYRPKVKTVNIVPKPVDEDLYKIPPELLHKSKKKKMWGFFSRCLVPSCSA